MSARVVVLGDVMTDVVARLSEPVAAGSDATAAISMHGGGSAANVTAWLAVAGTPVTLVARIGADALGRLQRDELAACGVAIRLAVDAERPTGTCVALVDPDGERSMLPDRGANDALQPDDVPADLLVAGAHLHVSGYALLHPGSRPAAVHAIALGRSTGMTVSVDASSAAPLAAWGARHFIAETRDVDLLLANAAEAALLSAELARFARAVVTRGPRGAAWYERGRLTAEVSAQPMAAIDTTGAGDAFAAGVLAGWLRGAAPDAALRGGTTLAARCVGHVGARPPGQAAATTSAPSSW